MLYLRNDWLIKIHDISYLVLNFLKTSLQIALNQPETSQVTVNDRSLKCVYLINGHNLHSSLSELFRSLFFLRFLLITSL